MKVDPSIAALALMAAACAVAAITVLTARGLVSLRQAGAALGGVAVGAALGWIWAGAGHG